MSQKKTIVINASPRKNWNTAQLCREAARGAEEAGAEVEYIDLYDLTFTGCRSCLACKLTNGKHPGCAWHDDLSPLIDRILAADALIIGSPIYWAEPTAQFRALMERLTFCCVPYQAGTYFDGRVDCGFIYTGNAGAEYFEQNMRPYFANIEGLFKMALHGDTRYYMCGDTLQVKDYSKYDMGYFDGDAKKVHREEQFPKDLEACYAMGAEMSAAEEA